MRTLLEIREDVREAAGRSDADALLRFADEFAEHDGDDARSREYQCRALAARYKADYTTALEYFHKAIPKLEALEDVGGLARVNGSIGIAHLSRGEYPQALEYFKIALHLYDDLGDKAGLAIFTGNVGIVYWSTNDLENARIQYEKALILHHEADDQIGAAQVTGNLGILHAQLGRHEAALSSFQHALDMYKVIGDELGADRMNVHLTETLIRMDRMEEARELLASVSNTTGNPITEFVVALCTAQMLEFDGKVDEATKMFEKALNISDKQGMRREQADTHKTLRDLARRRGDFDDYVIHNDQYIAITEEIKGAATSRQLAIQEKERELEAVERERERERAVLYSALPKEVADRVVAGERVNDLVENAAVMFVDIVGFTKLSSTIPADQVVNLLEVIFGLADQVVQDRGLTKVKTIGDSYLAVGLPDPEQPNGTTHIASTVDAALNIIDELSQLDLASAPSLQGQDWVQSIGPINVRAGIHAGTVVAGVVGRDRLQYDVWGDTVNVASRMESTGEPNRLQASVYLVDLLSDTAFSTEERGEQDIKGKGLMKTYWVSAK